MARCLIGLGSNQGPRRELLEQAVAALAAEPDVTLVACSAWHEFPPAGGPPRQPAFLNGAVVVETALAPEALLASLQQIEHRLGRRRGPRWGPRPIDLDLLLYDEVVCATAALILPHKRMAWRRFVLKPAVEVAAEMVHPCIGWTVGRLLEHLETTPFYVAITGGIGAGKTALACRLGERFGASLLGVPADPRRLEAFYRDPDSHAWPTELQFLEDRQALLSRSRPPGPRASACWVSNFWFDQSLAFARVWLAGRQLAEFEELWRMAREQVLQPRLIVLIDLPGELLWQRVQARGRPGEVQLGAERLEEIRQSVRAEATAPGKGPLLVWQDDDLDAACEEVGAAMAAMR